MGISGHMLGERGLRRLRTATGLPFAAAYRRNAENEAVVLLDDGSCEHYEFDLTAGTALPILSPMGHWSLCDHHRRRVEAERAGD